MWGVLREGFSVFTVAIIPEPNRRLIPDGDEAAMASKPVGWAGKCGHACAEPAEVNLLEVGMTGQMAAAVLGGAACPLDALFGREIPPVFIEIAVALLLILDP